MATPLVGRTEALVDTLLRSRGARYAGLLVGIGALAFLVLSLLNAGESALDWFRAVTPVQVAVALAGFGGLHVAMVLTLRAVFVGPALRLWGAAQLVKYLPVPGSALLGMVGSTVRGGGTTRQGVAVTLRHSLLQVGGAMIVGTAAAAPLAVRLLGIPIPVTAVAGLAAGAAVAWLGVRHLPLRSGLAATVLMVVAWQVLGLSLAYGVAQGVGPPVIVGASFAAAWVIGQLALPVPAGIGVREAVLVLLLGPVLGEVGALSFALGTRVLHVASDAVLALLVLGRGGVRTLGRPR
jgi:hypothetical protein